jgi:hypothetical protein
MERSMKGTARKSLAVITAFTGGLAAGYLLKSNRDEISHFSKSCDRLLNQGSTGLNHARKKVADEGRKALAGAGKRVKGLFGKPVPDLYEATDGLTLDEDDIAFGF